jgi:hypothetical protein
LPHTLRRVEADVVVTLLTLEVVSEVDVLVVAFDDDDVACVDDDDEHAAATTSSAMTVTRRHETMVNRDGRWIARAARRALSETCLQGLLAAYTTWIRSAALDDLNAIVPPLVLGGDRVTATRSPRERGPRASRARTARRAVAGAAAVLLILAGCSFASAVMVSNGDPFSANATEWFRDHHMSWLVDRIEAFWYSHHQPRAGGTPRGGIPIASTVPATQHAPTTGRVADAAPHRMPLCPAPLPPLADQPLAREGAWTSVGRAPGDVCFAYLRPDAVHTSVVIGVAWMNMSKLRATLHNGTSVPGGSGWRAGPAISPADYGRVAAAFNGGFRLGSSRGGYMTERRVVTPLVAGRASFVILANGRADVGMWGRDDVGATAASIVSVRQNLDLLVDGGNVVPATSDSNTDAWGATLGNQIYTWRSGVGVDRHGNLVYVGGNGLDVATLAAVLRDAGCVRAMELDINPEWVSLMVYGPGPTGVPSATKLLSSMQRPADRYLHTGTRDFIELDAR